MTEDLLAPWQLTDIRGRLSQVKTFPTVFLVVLPRIRPIRLVTVGPLIRIMRLIMDMPGAGICRVTLPSPLVTLGTMRVIVPVVLAAAGMTPSVVVWVWCKLWRSVLSRCRLLAQSRAAATAFPTTLKPLRSIPIMGVK